MRIKRILKAALFTPGASVYRDDSGQVITRWGLPLIVVGRPGTAKTSIYGELATETGLYFESIISSLREPADFLGLPIPRETHNGDLPSVDYAPPGWAKRVAVRVIKRAVKSAQQAGNGGRATVLLDEINTTPPATQAALLRTSLEGVVGDFVLPPGVRFVGAMNSTEEAAGGWDLAPPLANRFGHIEWPNLDVSDWCDYMVGGSNGDTHIGDAAAEEERVMRAWPDAIAKSTGLVTGFVRRRPELLLKMPEVGDPKASKAWPSPRTWTMATRAYAGAAIHGLDEEERDDFMAAFVGMGVVTEFAAWMSDQDLPEPAEVLDGKVKWKHDPQRLDTTAAVLSGCTALVAPDKATRRKERSAALWDIMHQITKTGAKDLVVPSARTLVRKQLSKSKEAKKVLVEIQPMLAAAGITP